MTTENKLTTLNIFPSEESYETNKGSLGNSDLALVPLVIPEQVNADWNSTSGASQILNKPNLATVATTGSYNDLSNLPSLNFVSTNGARGGLSGYETPLVQSSALTVNASTRDTSTVTGAVAITVQNGSSGQAWTKVVSLTNASATVSLGTSWQWQYGVAPTVAQNCVLILHWNDSFGIASLLKSST